MFRSKDPAAKGNTQYFYVFESGGYCYKVLHLECATKVDLIHTSFVIAAVTRCARVGPQGTWMVPMTTMTDNQGHTSSVGIVQRWKVPKLMASHTVTGNSMNSAGLRGKKFVLNLLPVNITDR